MSLIEPDLVMFHGGRINGNIVELHTRAGSMAYGPGFYLTTSYWTAREYRGGNGFVYKVQVKTPLRWDHEVRLNTQQVDTFLSSIPKLKRRSDVLEDLGVLSARRPDGTVTMTGILNTLSNNGSYGASVAREVARAIINAGCDASLITGANGGGEDWIALHNVSKVRSVEKTTGPEEDRPRLKPY